MLSEANALGVYAINFMMISKTKRTLITMMIVSCSAKMPSPPFSVEGEPNLFSKSKFMSKRIK